jgi:outer membrane protein assembly factor BamE (lipoprotein component of BamABCDE complex)
MRPPKLVLPALLLATLLPACLVTSNGDTTYSGQHISAETYAQVKKGTTQGFVLATFGEPTSRTTLEDGSQIWRWRSTQTRSSSGTVILLLSSSNRTETQHNTFVELKDGLVVRVWRD